MISSSTPLIAMTRHNKRRLAVESDGHYVGVLEDIDILGLVAGNSQLIPGRIERARAVDDLILSAGDIQSQVERLAQAGRAGRGDRRDHLRSQSPPVRQAVRPDRIAGHSRGRLSHGHGLGRTRRADRAHRPGQRPAAVAPVPEAELQAFRDGFTDALERFGFPPCPGNVMVRNPQWSQPIESFIRQLKSWVLTPDDESPINLGIFFDAVPVIGHHDLLDRAKTAMIEMMRGESAYLSHFARAIDQFEGASAGMLTSIMASVGVGSDEIDIKKSGTFPIVHGIRTFAIDEGLKEVSTVQRIEALAANGDSAPNSPAISAARCPISWRSGCARSCAR